MSYQRRKSFRLLSNNNQKRVSVVQIISCLHRLTALFVVLRQVCLFYCQLLFTVTFTHPMMLLCNNSSGLQKHCPGIVATNVSSSCRHNNCHVQIVTFPDCHISGMSPIYKFSRFQIFVFVFKKNTNTAE